MNKSLVVFFGGASLLGALACGSDGAKGDQGPAGPQGGTGAAGAVGAQGDPGPAGATGAFDPSVAVGGIKVGTSTNACSAATAGTLRYNGTTNEMEYCNGTEYLGLGGSTATYRSCLTIKTANAAATDGVYTLAAAGMTFRAQCDMTNGGWTLIQSHVAAQPSSELGVVTPGSKTWLPGSIVRALAYNSTNVKIGVRGTHDVISSSDTFPITRLRQLRTLSDDANMSNNQAHWTFDAQATVSAANINYSCATNANPTSPAPRYPAIYWSCGNGAGLHVLAAEEDPTVHGFAANNSQDIDVWVQ